VAALIARGYTNRRIAETLVVAESTVARHVANILNKLGFHARAQIGAYVGRTAS
jgi:DNA-binding NarL/FixJ family response regulator